MEAELGQGPDLARHQRFSANAQPQALYQKVLASGVLHPLEGCSDHPHSHVTAHFVNHEAAKTQTDLTTILTQAVDYGHPQLADEAQTFLETLGGKAGLSPPKAEAHFEQLSWDGEIGRTQLVFHDPVWDGVPPLAVVDVQDKLSLESDLRSLLRVDSGTLSEASLLTCGAGFHPRCPELSTTSGRAPERTLGG